MGSMNVGKGEEPDGHSGPAAGAHRPPPLHCAGNRGRGEEQ